MVRKRITANLRHLTSATLKSRYKNVMILASSIHEIVKSRFFQSATYGAERRSKIIESVKRHNGMALYDHHTTKRWKVYIMLINGYRPGSEMSPIYAVWPLVLQLRIFRRALRPATTRGTPVPSYFPGAPCPLNLFFLLNFLLVIYDTSSIREPPKYQDSHLPGGRIRGKKPRPAHFHPKPTVRIWWSLTNPFRSYAMIQTRAHMPDPPH
jgi:hypothetical protein